ncbi:phytanoyl-CoA dioxygenase family protein [Paenibacillus cymbidii]|uniref:phytanoyl-CoA dioxygenase family protein n=1 Tax=Paenibacillus cymbidii TaxID=1639034 RepID=UPI0014368016|nr:phytanoyl-CoA dioxygenase family protein [Paenibacillus cymbidii]
MILQNVLSPAEIQSVTDLIARVMDEKTEVLFREGRIANKYAELPVETRWAKICEMSPQQASGWNQEVFSQAVYELCTNSKLLNSCEQYLGPEITLNGDYWVRPKVPHEDLTTLPWHQDSFYYNGAENDNLSYRILSFWIPLVDVDERNGCMQVIPGSHKWGLIPYASLGNKRVPVEDVEARGEVITARMKKGDILIFNQLTLHRSLPNVSEGVRWSIDIRYTPTGQSFSWHELTGPGFEQRYSTLIVRSRCNPERVQDFNDWKTKKQ